MSFESALFTWLKSNVPSVSSRIYALTAPENVAEPYLVYRKVSAPRTYHFDGQDGFVAARIQFDCVAGLYVTAKAISEELRCALSGFRGLMGAVAVSSAFLDNEIDGDDPAAGLFWVTCDYLITHAE
jgi:hypothetical protein